MIFQESKINRGLFVITTSLMFLLLTACPYDSQIGLNTYEESLKLDKAFFGEWTCFNEDGSKEEIQIEKGMKQVYNIRHNSYDVVNKKSEYNYYRGFMTIIKGMEILNLEKKDGNFNFYKYELKGPDELHLFAIGEDFVKNNYDKAETPDLKSLRAFIELHLAETGLFEEPMRFVKNGSKTFNKYKK